MKHTIAAATIACALLTACGGGSSSTPAPPATAVPTASPVAITTRLLWTGLAARGASAYDRIALGYRSIRDVGFASPVVMIAPDSAANAGSGANGSGAELLLAASPLPSSSPAVTFTVSAPNVSVPTSATPPPGSVAAANIASTVVGAASSGSAQAQSSALPSPAAIPVLVFKGDHVACGIANSNPGVAIADDATETAAASPATSDLHVLGSNCPPAFNVPSGDPNDATLHAPYGAVVITIPAGGYTAITTAMFVGATKTTLVGADVTPTTAFLFKNHNGTVCKTYSLVTQVGLAGNLLGPVACHGTSPDGF